MESASTPRQPTMQAKPAQQGLNFHDLLEVLKLRKGLIYALTAIALFGSVVRHILYVPTYTAQTLLSVQKAGDNAMQIALANLGAAPIESQDQLKKYLDYIQSRDFFIAVAESLKFQEGYQRLKLTHPGEMSLLHKAFWVHFIESKFGKKIATTDVEVEPVLMPVEELANVLKNITFAIGQGSDTIRIQVTTLDSFTSMVLANFITEVFIKKTTERDYNEVGEVRNFIQEQLGGTTERLKRAESSLVEFKRKHSIISISAEHTSYSGKLNSIETELESAKLKFQENQRLINFYEKILNKHEAQLLSQGAKGIRNSQPEMVSRLRQQLDALRSKKVLMQAQGFEESSWQMQDLNHEIDDSAKLLKEQLSHGDPGSSTGEDDVGVSADTSRSKLWALKNENKVLEAKLASIERSREELLKNLETLPKDEQVLLTLTRDLDLQFELYSSLKKKLQEVEIQQVALRSRVLLTERADQPGPAPRTGFFAKILFAILVGLFLGSSGAFLFEAIDPTVKHLSDLEKLELVVLGQVPHIEGSSIRKSLGSHTYRPDLLICKEKPEGRESMAFKYLRAQITRYRTTDGAPSKVISVTSPEKGDGKSFIAANLAISLAQLEKRTLLIDCDLRNPSQPWLFGYKEGVGLSSLLSFKCTLDEAVLRNRIQNLDILPAGWTPSNPSEMISNDKFHLLLEHLKGLYDYVILDSPAASTVVDAAVLAGLSDNVILTACYRKTKKDVLIHALRKILQVSNKQINAVLNNVWEAREISTLFEDENPISVSRGEKVDSRDELERFEKLLVSKKAG